MHQGRWLWMGEPSSLFSRTARAVPQSRRKRASDSAHTFMLKDMFHQFVVSLPNVFVDRKLQRGDRMNPIFEDMFLGPMASPSFSPALRFRWEDSRRRVHVVYGGITVADSTHIMLLH